MAKRSGLGRGLESLLGETAGELGSEATEGGATTLPMADVHPNPNQPRKNFDEGALGELAESIRQNGIIQPILVRPHGTSYQIVAGERRYQAALLAGLADVPVVIRDVTDEEVLGLALIENLQREDLNPIETALGYRELIREHGLTQEQLASLVSKSRPAISNAIRLLDLPKEVQDLLARGSLSAGHARALLALPDDSSVTEVANRVVREGLSVRQTENLVSLFFGRKTSAGKDDGPVARGVDYGPLSARLQEALGTKVKVRDVRGRRKIEIDLTDDETFDKIVALLTRD